MRLTELPALTGIRFYAALLVYLSHVPVIPGMEALSGNRLLFNSGVVGVAFFFVLSGFILTYNYAAIFRSGVSGIHYRRFVWDRLTKIYPVHFIALLMILPIAILSPNLPFDWRAVPFHLLLLQCFWPFDDARLGSYLNVPSWSISCEWFFYLVAPAAIYVASRRPGRWALVVGAAGYAAAGYYLFRGQSEYTRLTFVSWFAPTRLLEFLTGVLLAHFFLTGQTGPFFAARRWLQGTGLILIAAGAIYRPHAPWPLWGGLLYLPGSALLVLGLAFGRTIVATHLSWSWIKRFGTASFSLYLIHAPILRAVRGVCLWLHWEVHSWSGFWTVTAGMFLLIQIAAIKVCSVYEVPVQKYLRGLLVFGTSARSGMPVPVESR